MTDIQVGDLIRSYYAIGFQQVTAVHIYTGDSACSRIDYIQVMHDDGRLCSPVKGYAHPQLCTIVDEAEINNIINSESARLELKRINLLNLLRKS
jgi:glycine betaine/choline ABC-type transport system substrate-binding protein